MNKTYTTRAIILNRKDFGEADRLFVLYTQDYGKIEAIATSARKATSKMAKFLEPMMEIELLLARGRNYDKIAEVGLIDNFAELKSESRQWALGCYCLEVVDKLTKVEAPQKDIFDLVKNILNLLKKRNNSLVQFYVWQLLDRLGYKPKLEECVGCGEKFVATNPPLTPPREGDTPLPPPAEGVRGRVEKVGFTQIHSMCSTARINFNPSKGGILCQKCSMAQQDNSEISLAALEILKKGLKEDLVNLQDLDIEHKESGSINQAISSLLNFHLDYELNSVKFLAI